VRARHVEPNGAGRRVGFLPFIMPLAFCL
jgi:hypothetical protein